MSLFDHYVPFYLMNEALLEKLSQCLNLSIKELKTIEPDLCPESAADGTLISYLILFKESAPRKILAKIEGIEFDNTVRLDLSPTPVVKMYRQSTLSRDRESN